MSDLRLPGGFVLPHLPIPLTSFPRRPPECVRSCRSTSSWSRATRCSALSRRVLQSRAGLAGRRRRTPCLGGTPCRRATATSTVVPPNGATAMSCRCATAASCQASLTLGIAPLTGPGAFAPREGWAGYSRPIVMVHGGHEEAVFFLYDPMHAVHRSSWHLLLARVGETRTKKKRHVVDEVCRQSTAV